MFQVSEKASEMIKKDYLKDKGENFAIRLVMQEDD